MDAFSNPTIETLFEHAGTNPATESSIDLMLHISFHSPTPISIPFFPSEGEMEMFRMSVKIPGRNRAIFLLTYEELLQRRLGYYQHVTSVRPMQLVSKLSVAVTIVEHSRIKSLEVLPLRRSRTSGSRNSSKTDGISLITGILSIV